MHDLCLPTHARSLASQLYCCCVPAYNTQAFPAVVYTTTYRWSTDPRFLGGSVNISTTCDVCYNATKCRWTIARSITELNSLLQYDQCLAYPAATSRYIPNILGYGPPTFKQGYPSPFSLQDPYQITLYRTQLQGQTSPTCATIHCRCLVALIPWVVKPPHLVTQEPKLSYSISWLFW